MKIFQLDHDVFLGQRLVLQGQVYGTPRPAIVWQHPRGQTLVDDRVNIHTHYGDDGTIQLEVNPIEREETLPNSSSLQLVSVTAQDDGIYECIATSSRGTVSQQIHVQIKGRIKAFLPMDIFDTLESNNGHKLEEVRWSTRYSPNDYREVNEIAR